MTTKAYVLAVSLILVIQLSSAMDQEEICDIHIRLFHSVNAEKYTGTADFSIKRIEDDKTLRVTENNQPAVYEFEGLCGFYEVSIKAPAFEVVKIAVPVFGSSKLPVYLDLGQIVDEPHRVLKGRIVSDTEDASGLWLKLVRVQGFDSVAGSLPLYQAVFVEEDGSFEIGGLSPGKYVVLMFKNDEQGMESTKMKILAIEEIAISDPAGNVERKEYHVELDWESVIERERIE